MSEPDRSGHGLRAANECVRPGHINLTFGLVERLGRGIGAGEFDACGFPTELQLSTEHRASRSVVREAVKVLSAKGLLLSRSGRGIELLPFEHWSLFDPDVVRWLTAGHIRVGVLTHLEVLRSAVAPEAAALTARVSGIEATPRLRELAATIRTWDHRLTEAVHAIGVFHSVILKSSGNPFYGQLDALTISTIQAAARKCGGRTVVGEYAAQYHFVADAIAEHDECRARIAMSEIRISLAGAG